MKYTYILLIGDQNSGKTSLINALCNEPIATFSTIYQEFRKVQIANLQINIYDCPGNPQQQYNIQQNASVGAIALNLEQQNPWLQLEYHYNLIKDKPLIFFIGCKSDKTLHSYNVIKQQIQKILKIQNIILYFTSALIQKEILNFQENLIQLLYQRYQIFDDELYYQSKYVSYLEEEEESTFLDKCSKLFNTFCFCLKNQE